jgi:hypothetical protein
MPKKQARGAAGKSRRNQRIRKELMAAGFTEEQARRYIWEKGQLAHQQNILRQRAEAEEWRRRAAQEKKDFPVQPNEPHSIDFNKVIRSAWETDRRKH